MDKLKNLEALQAFALPKSEAESVQGGRTVGFAEGDAGDCHKVVDANDGAIRKIKWKPRYQGRC